MVNKEFGGTGGAIFYAPSLPHDRYEIGSVTVWGGVTTNERTDLHICQGTVSGVYYRDNIIGPLVILFAAANGNVFFSSNARAHRAHVVLNHLQTRGIQPLPWPAMSPELFPKEHVWDILGRRVQGHVPAPRNLQELASVLQEEWRRIPQNDIRRLVGSMRRRCVACLAANGGPTRY